VSFEKNLRGCWVIFEKNIVGSIKEG